jgi:hypothetical protein
MPPAALRAANAWYNKKNEQVFVNWRDILALYFRNKVYRRNIKHGKIRERRGRGRRGREEEREGRRRKIEKEVVGR